MSNVPENVKKTLVDLGFDKNDYWSLPQNKDVTILTHRALKELRHKGVVLDPPQIIEADGANKRAAVLVVGHYDGKTEWSFGEAAPQNNKNAYPWAMAEKRAGRGILKLVGLHGDVYSSVDDFEADQRQNDQAPKPKPQQNATAAPVPVEQPASSVIDEKQVAEIEKLRKSAGIQLANLEAMLTHPVDQTSVDRYPKVIKFLEDRQLLATYQRRDEQRSPEWFAQGAISHGI